jgi:hypothetical protein
MRITSRVAMIVAGLAALVTPIAQGYPISPVPLWSLVQESETVVLARVVEVAQRPKPPGKEADPFEFPESVATLRIVETWKGPASGEIEVEFPASLICPAPPRYVEDEDVVAFLARSESGWVTVGLSYGTLYAESRDALEDLRVMVRRAVALQAKGRVRKADRIDWLVEAATRPGTRWHGLYELAPEGDELHSLYDQGAARKSPRLAPAQRRRIARGFVEGPSMDQTLPMILKVLAGYHDSKVDETAASALEGLLGEKRLPYWTEQSLKLVLQRFGDPKAAERVARLRNGCCDFDEDGARALWRSAQQELSIPKVIPLRPVFRKVGGVGPQTPD